ncbi:MAG: RluA family pseudouridine synthase [Erysipelotrichales bacterium]|nr:RluA family pseudouridine synthase [Erysipelotrichales bacterium]
MVKSSRKKRNSIKDLPYNKRTQLKEYKVKESTTLLEFLLITLKGQSRNNVKSLLTHRQVLIDGAPVTQYDFVLSAGDIVMVSPAPVRKITNPKEKLDIIYEDDELIAINKPSGLLSIASDREKELTAYRLLMDHVRLTNPRNRIYVVHRIDKDTSGVLIVAKNEKLRDLLQDRWNNIVKYRGYYAIIEGSLKEKEGRIRSWLREASTNLMYSSRKPGDGKESITNYRVIKEISEYSLLDVNIETGRKNQIRVHMKDLGHNIIGDDRYGATKNPLNRLGLHAYSLEFIHPISKKMMKFEAKMPAEFVSMFGIKEKQLKRK